MKSFNSDSISSLTVIYSHHNSIKKTTVQFSKKQQR